MPQESPRIAELRRRVQADPASIAFGQLAEEYRRAGQYTDAVQCCRTGLTRHPGYLSARVTLGRALMELGSLEEAAQEFDLVLRYASDNLAAIRGMAEIHQRRGAMEGALDYYQRALELARFDPDLEETVQRIQRELGEVESSSSEEAQSEPSSAASGVADAAAPAAADDSLIDFDALLATLGAPDASPPPSMEMLLSEPVATPVRPEPVLPDAPTEAPLSDPFAALEAGLRAWDAGVSRAAAETTVEPAASEPAAAASPLAPAGDSQQPTEANDNVLAELESWLEALVSQSEEPPAV